MAKTAPSRARTSYRCSECGWTTAKWVGRCGECQTWGSVEEAQPTGPRTAAATSVRPAVPIGQVDPSEAASSSTGVGEFDRVLGGGLVRGAVVLVAGEPGIGKSTLLLDVAARTARTGKRVLYVSGEESAAQVRGRAARIGAIADQLYLAAETDLATVLGQIERLEPDLLVIDSVQTISSTLIDGAAGNVAQVREVAASLIATAKTRGLSTLLVGHVTKDGSIAGPRILEHLVDVVVGFEGERHSRLRLVRAVKNRYGPTDEVGCFDLSDLGIEGLTDPSGLFLSSRDEAAPGTAITVTLEGRRPLIAEVQALVMDNDSPNPRRTTSGLEHNRVAMVQAVLHKHSGQSALRTIARHDLYVSTVGGVRLTEPASDLAVAMAVHGSAVNAAMEPSTIVIGEVGLAGEVRPVSGLERRLSEAARLGFTRAVVPAGDAGSARTPTGVRLDPVRNVAEAIRVAYPTVRVVRAAR